MLHFLLKKSMTVDDYCCFSKDINLRWYYARFVDAPKLLNLLALDKEPVVRNAISRNPNASEEVILKIKSYNKFKLLTQCLRKE